MWQASKVDHKVGYQLLRLTKSRDNLLKLTSTKKKEKKCHLATKSAFGSLNLLLQIHFFLSKKGSKSIILPHFSQSGPRVSFPGSCSLVYLTYSILFFSLFSNSSCLLMTSFRAASSTELRPVRSGDGGGCGLRGLCNSLLIGNKWRPLNA